MAAGRPSKYDPAMCETVIECGREGMGKAEMAAALDIDRATLADWCTKKPEFSSAVKRALDLSQAWWEQKGRLATIGEVDGFNATSFIFNMKNRFKEDWKDRHEVKNEHDLSDPMKELMEHVASNGKRVGNG